MLVHCLAIGLRAQVLAIMPFAKPSQLLILYLFGVCNRSIDSGLSLCYAKNELH
jgi:hypothetical protein